MHYYHRFSWGYAETVNGVQVCACVDSIRTSSLVRTLTVEQRKAWRKHGVCRA